MPELLSVVSFAWLPSLIIYFINNEKFRKKAFLVYLGLFLLVIVLELILGNYTAWDGECLFGCYDRGYAVPEIFYYLLSILIGSVISLVFWLLSFIDSNMTSEVKKKKIFYIILFLLGAIPEYSVLYYCILVGDGFKDPWRLIVLFLFAAPFILVGILFKIIAYVKLKK